MLLLSWHWRKQLPPGLCSTEVADRSPRLLCTFCAGCPGAPPPVTNALPPACRDGQVDAVSVLYTLVAFGVLPAMQGTSKTLMTLASSTISLRSELCVCVRVCREGRGRGGGAGGRQPCVDKVCACVYVCHAASSRAQAATTDTNFAFNGLGLDEFTVCNLLAGVCVYLQQPKCRRCSQRGTRAHWACSCQVCLRELHQPSRAAGLEVVRP